MATMAPAEPVSPYPVRVWAEYPDRLSRLSTAFRLILIIPVWLFSYLLGGGITGAIWAAVLVRGRIPHWLFDFQVGINRFSTRAAAYGLLLTDRYPAFEGDWVVGYYVDYPERISRWKLLFWKLFSSIPHFLILVFLNIAVAVVVFIAWFGILFTGRYPRGLHKFVVGVLRWNQRVGAYVTSLTDAYPPFSLDEDAAPGSSSAEIISGVIGFFAAGLISALIAVGIAVAYQYSNKEKSADVAYDDALAGQTGGEAVVEMDNISFSLDAVEDDAAFDIVRPREGRRLVAVTVLYQGLRNEFDDQHRIERDRIRIETDAGTKKPILLTFDGSPAPIDVEEGSVGELLAVFEIDEDAEIEGIRAYPNEGNDRHVTWNLVR